MHLERSTAVVDRELERYNIDIAALLETRLGEEGQICEKGAGYIFFWKGKPAGVKREGGVGFGVWNAIVKNIEHPEGISDRIMYLRVLLAGGRFISVISVYAPTLTSTDEVIMSFYQDLRNCLNSMAPAEKIVLLGDFNARVDCHDDTWGALGKFGMGKTNSSGLLLLQLCTELDLAICNTYIIS